MSEPVRLKAGALLQLGTGAARRQPGLVLPLALAEVCAGLLGLVPAGLLLVRLLAVVARIEEPDPGLAFIEAVLVTSTDPGLLALATIGALLAGAGGWLLRTTVRAGAARALAAELQEDPERVR